MLLIQDLITISLPDVLTVLKCRTEAEAFISLVITIEQIDSYIRSSLIMMKQENIFTTLFESTALGIDPNDVAINPVLFTAVNIVKGQLVVIMKKIKSLISSLLEIEHRLKLCSEQNLGLSSELLVCGCTILAHEKKFLGEFEQNICQRIRLLCNIIPNENIDFNTLPNFSIRLGSLVNTLHPLQNQFKGFKSSHETVRENVQHPDSLPTSTSSTASPLKHSPLSTSLTSPISPSENVIPRIDKNCKPNNRDCESALEQKDYPKKLLDEDTRSHTSSQHPRPLCQLREHLSPSTPIPPRFLGKRTVSEETPPDGTAPPSASPASHSNRLDGGGGGSALEGMTGGPKRSLFVAGKDLALANSATMSSGVSSNISDNQSISSMRFPITTSQPPATITTNTISTTHIARHSTVRKRLKIANEIIREDVRVLDTRINESNSQSGEDDRNSNVGRFCTGSVKSCGTVDASDNKQHIPTPVVVEASQEIQLEDAGVDSMKCFSDNLRGGGRKPKVEQQSCSASQPYPGCAVQGDGVEDDSNGNMSIIPEHTGAISLAVEAQLQVDSAGESVTVDDIVGHHFREENDSNSKLQSPTTLTSYSSTQSSA